MLISRSITDFAHVEGGIPDGGRIKEKLHKPPPRTQLDSANGCKSSNTINLHFFLPYKYLKYDMRMIFNVDFLELIC